MISSIKLSILTLLSIGVMSLVILAPLRVSAQDAAIDDACRNAPGSPICDDLQSQQNPVSGDNGLFASVFDILSFVAGVIAVVIIVIGGIQMMTSDGDPQKFGAARNLLIYAIVGIVIVLSAQVIVRVVVYALID